jgi:hypothetical protein
MIGQQSRMGIIVPISKELRTLIAVGGQALSQA